LYANGAEAEDELLFEHIPWSSLVLEQQGSSSSPTCIGAGAFGIVFRAIWLRGKAKKQSVQVAIKIFKISIMGKLASFASIEQNLLDEARMLHQASDCDVNAFVVKLFGVSSGFVTPEWVAALGFSDPWCWSSTRRSRRKETEREVEVVEAAARCSR